MKLAACLFPLVLLFACAEPTSPIQEWGFRGSAPGRFSSPRGIAVNEEFVYVIDRTGRVQQFNHQGGVTQTWTLENQDNGTPTGVAAHPDGTLWIADTHNSQILHYSSQGELLGKFGDYGEEAGRFIFPTDIAFGDGLELFISEYGKEDRIQVFSNTGEYKRHWGSFGDGLDQLNRPMAIINTPDGNLAVADTVNHRIKLYRQDGTLLFTFGEQGQAAGQLSYPYDLDIDSEGNIFTIEFGAHRVQKWAPDGKWLSSWGSAGSGLNQLAEPWGISLWDSTLYIADTKNHRALALPASFL